MSKLDNYYNNLLISKYSLNEFLLLYSLETTDKKYLITYGTVMLIGLDYNTYFQLEDYSKFRDLLIYIYNNTLDNFKKPILDRVIKGVKESTITINGVDKLLGIDFIWNNELEWIAENFSKPDFYIDFPIKSLLGILLANKISSCEYNTDIEISTNNKNYLRRILKKYFTRLLNIDSGELLYKIFNNIYNNNTNKIDVGLSYYYCDTKNSYNFLENLYSQLLHITKTKLALITDDWLELNYKYYRIIYYSLITQINNGKLILNTLNNDIFINTINIDINKNMLYLSYTYNIKRLTNYICKYKNKYHLELEDYYYEILTFYKYYIDIVNLELITDIITKSINPHNRIFASNILYKYNISLDKELLEKLVELNIYIDTMKGLDDVLHKFTNQSIITKMLLDNNYITDNKNLYIVLFRQLTVKINWVISSLTLLFLNKSVNIEILDHNVKLYEHDFKKIGYVLDYILKSIDIFTNNRDLLYHLVKFIYGLFKNLYGKDSYIFKINYNPNKIDSNFWQLFKIYILDKLDFDIIFRIPSFLDLLLQYYIDIKPLIEIYDVEYGKSYLDIMNNITAKELDLPDEFLDPILYTPIHDAVILPSSKIIVDKTIIMAHLLQDKYDPFNRQPLTIEELDKYNKEEDVILKCREFAERRDKYIISHYHT
jgi:hypothetical protein